MGDYSSSAKLISRGGVRVGVLVAIDVTIFEPVLGHDVRLGVERPTRLNDKFNVTERDGEHGKRSILRRMEQFNLIRGRATPDGARAKYGGARRARVHRGWTSSAERVGELTPPRGARQTGVDEDVESRENVFASVDDADGDLDADARADDGGRGSGGFDVEDVDL